MAMVWQLYLYDSTHTTWLLFNKVVETIILIFTHFTKNVRNLLGHSCSSFRKRNKIKTLKQQLDETFNCISDSASSLSAPPPQNTLLPSLVAWIKCIQRCPKWITILFTKPWLSIIVLVFRLSLVAGLETVFCNIL